MQGWEIPFSTSNSYSFAITDLIAIIHKSVYCPEVKVPRMPPRSQEAPENSWGKQLCEGFVRRAAWLCVSLRANAITAVLKQSNIKGNSRQICKQTDLPHFKHFCRAANREVHSSWHTGRKLSVLTDTVKNVDSPYPFHVEPGIGSQPVLMELQPPGCPPDGGRGRQEPCPLDGAKPGHVLSTPDAIQEANEEQVGGQLLDAAEHQGPALGAPELLLGFQDPLQTGLAERVLAGEHLGRGVELLKAYRALQQVEES